MRIRLYRLQNSSPRELPFQTRPRQFYVIAFDRVMHPFTRRLKCCYARPPCQYDELNPLSSGTRDRPTVNGKESQSASQTASQDAECLLLCTLLLPHLAKKGWGWVDLYGIRGNRQCKVLPYPEGSVSQSVSQSMILGCFTTKRAVFLYWEGGGDKFLSCCSIS